jgi:hypothetical protein
MPSYETLDAIADTYVPLLAVVAFALIIVALFKRAWLVAGVWFATLGAALAVAYGFMFIDRHFGLWSTLGLDYSTHTAVALALLAPIITHLPRFAALWAGTLAAYVLLMLYQGYHTVSDIAVTAGAVIVPIWLVAARGSGIWPFSDTATTRQTTNEPSGRNDV